MDIYRCDYDVRSDLVLENAGHHLMIKTIPAHTVIFRNATVDEQGHVPMLIVTVIGPASSFEAAAGELRRVLAKELDSLGFLTHSRLKVIGPRRLIEWNDHQVTRRFKIFARLDARYPPAAGLTKEYVDSLSAFNAVPEYVQKALRNFRYGLLEEVPEDQFMRFWLALEILAINMHKGLSQEVFCRACNVPAKCASCGHVPPAVRSSKVAIVALIEKIVGRNARTVYEKLFAARNGIAHGKSAESVLSDAKVSWEKLLSVLGKLTSDAILLAIDPVQKLPRPFPTYAGRFLSLTLVGGALGTFEFTGTDRHPREDELPSPSLEIIVD